MRAAQRGRQCLKGRWKGAVAVEIIRVLAGLLLLLLELGAVQLGGLSLSETLRLADRADGLRFWLYVGILLGVTVLDLFVVSPLLLGRAAFYDRLSEGQERPAKRTCIFQTVRFPADIDSLLTDTHEFVPVPAGKQGPASVRIIWRFYGKGYWRAVGWRAVLWGKGCLYSFFCFAPAALIWGYGDALQAIGEATPFRDITNLFCELFGLFALLAGWVIWQLLMLRYMPAQYAVAQGRPLRAAFRESRRRMKGQVGEIAWLYLGFAGWLAACLLVVPYGYAAPLFQATRAAMVRRLPEEQKERVCRKKPSRLRAQRFPGIVH